ncbi:MULTISPECIES: hypothetical protein [unclassified Lonepinella]|uniref:hypothetical protein n=1 Tax=unclassified Lonepinella TaxID=2642006 RepID=UPI003F6DC7F5
MYDVSLKRKWDEYSLLTSAETRGIRQGLQRGLEQGLQQGRLDTLKESARNMLNLGVDVATISQYLNLPIEDVRKLQH